MNGYPQTRKEMLRANYKLVSTKACRNCKIVTVELWKTTHGKFLALDLPTRKVNPDEEITQLHQCGNKPAVTHRRELSLAEEQRRAIDLLATQLKARAVVAVMEDNFIYSVKRGIPAEDLRHELITAANDVRRFVEGQNG